MNYLKKHFFGILIFLRRMFWLKQNQFLLRMVDKNVERKIFIQVFCQQFAMKIHFV